MTDLDILQAQLDRAQRFNSKLENRQALESALQLLRSACGCGAELTLNPRQTQALAYFVEGQQAIREIRAREVTREINGESFGDSTPENLIAHDFG